MLSPTEFVSTHLKKLADYINGITGNTIICNKYERLAVDRFHAHRLQYIYKYKEQEVIKALRFFSLLNIQIKNEAAQCEIMDFQMLWLASIVGLWKTETETLYSQSFILVAKKNNKSGFAAIMSLYFLLCKNILNAHSLLVGASREQAKTLINYVEFIVKNSPAISPLFKVNKNVIFNRTDKSYNRIEIRSSDAGKINSIGVGLGLSVCDEYAYHKDNVLQTSIKSAQIVQPNNHQLIISTTSNNQTNPAFELFESAKNVLEGVIINDDLFTVVYTLDNKEEYKDPANYRKSNPAIGHTITSEALQREVRSAMAMPQQLETVLSGQASCSPLCNNLYR